MSYPLRVAVISPTDHLERFSSQGDINMCISSVCLEDVLYSDYYYRAAQRKYTILDNGAFELNKSLSATSLLDVARRVVPTCLVTPEVLENRRDTVSLSRSFVKSFGKYLQGNSLDHLPTSEKVRFFRMELMTVVQGKNLDEWLKCFDQLLHAEGLHRLGIPFDMDFLDIDHRSQTNNWMWNRVVIIQKLLKKYYRLPSLHLMGCSNIFELYLQSTLNNCNMLSMTLDTSAPVVHGMNDVLFTPCGISQEKIKKKLNFQGTIPSSKFKTIDANIQQMKRFSTGVI